MHSERTMTSLTPVVAPPLSGATSPTVYGVGGGPGGAVGSPGPKRSGSGTGNTLKVMAEPHSTPVSRSNRITSCNNLRRTSSKAGVLVIVLSWVFTCFYNKLNVWDCGESTTAPMVHFTSKHPITNPIKQDPFGLASTWCLPGCHGDTD